MKKLRITTLAIFSILAFASCSKDEEPTIAPPVNEEEVITTVKATFTPQGGGTAITLLYKDLDGDDGPGAATITVSGAFAQNKTYDGQVEFLNESVSPTVDITAEIIAEGVDHQVFYQKTGTLNPFTYSTVTSNFDVNGKPIGLKSVFGTTGAASGNLKITLRHEPNKSGVGVSGGDITNAAGSTDVEVTFPISVI